MMPAEAPPGPFAIARPALTAIYHITHARNLAGIAGRGGLCCDRIRIAEGITNVNIAHAGIKQWRMARAVKAGPGGVIADYVPFYFAPRSPMLYSINGGYVAGYTEGQRLVVHLVSSAEAVKAAGLRFAFTDGHAPMAVSRHFDDLAHLDEVDWSVMPLTFWNDTQDDPDRKRRRQAEFLVHGRCPWELIHEVGVMDAKIAEAVEGLLERMGGHRPSVKVHRDWYY